MHLVERIGTDRLIGLSLLVGLAILALLRQL